MLEQNKIPETPVASDNKLLIEIALKKRLAHLIQKLHQGSLSQAEIKELKQFGGTPLPAGCVWTQKEIAEAFDVTRRTVERWIERGMPKESDGYYHLIKICYWKMADEADKTSEEDWNKTNKKFSALIKKLEYKQLSGDLIRRKDIEDIFRRKILAFARSYGALPREAAPAMEGMDVRQKVAYLTERINDIHNQFAEPIFEEEEENGESQEKGQDGLEPGGEGNPEAPAEDNNQPVE